MTNKFLAIKFLKREFGLTPDDIHYSSWSEENALEAVLEFAEYLDRKEAREKK